MGLYVGAADWTDTAHITGLNVALASGVSGTTSAENRVMSMGTDLIVNGSGTLGDNTNFSAFTFTASDAPTGAAGSFLTGPLGVASSPQLDGLLPVNPDKHLMLSLQARETGSSVSGYMYAFLAPYDAYKNSILPNYYMYSAGTQTTLAVALNPGDTTITLTSSTNWYGSTVKPATTSVHFRSIIWWDFTDAGGKLWPIGTYSRNYSGVDYWADGGITGNVITLRAAYSGPVRPIGTALSGGSSGGTYLYGALINTLVPQVWTRYSEVISGLTTGGAGATFASGWPPGVGYTKVGFLTNRTVTGPSAVNSRHAVASVSLSDASAAQFTADSAVTSLAGKADTAHTHVAANVTDFSTAADARVVAGITSKANLASPTFTGTVGGVTAAMVGALPSGSAVTVAQGGTGATTAAAARAALVVASLSHVHSGSEITNGSVAVANGGTGAITAPAALTALGAAPIASPTFTGTVGGVTAAMVGALPTGKPIGLARRTTTALSTGNSVYANMSADAAWGSMELLGGMTYSAGFIVPAGGAGLYVVEWQLLTVGSVLAIIGIAVNQVSAPTVDLLHAGGTVQNAGAILGNGSAMVRLAAADKVTLWGYGNAAAVVINALANKAPHWGLRWIAA